MSNFRSDQDVTYWSIASTDDNGDPTFNVGINIKARWTRKDGVFTDDKGDDHKFSFVIHSDILIPKRSLVVLEDQNGVAAPITGAKKVIDTSENPGMSDRKRILI